MANRKKFKALYDDPLWREQELLMLQNKNLGAKGITVCHVCIDALTSFNKFFFFEPNEKF